MVIMIHKYPCFKDYFKKWVCNKNDRFWTVKGQLN